MAKSASRAAKAAGQVSSDDLIQFYRDMLLIRRFEEKAGQLYGMGLIGGFYVGFYGGTSLTIFDFNTLLLLLAMIVVGGVGSAKGAILGTALLLYIDRTYADLDNPAWRFVWIGIIMFAITIGTTRGIVGLPAQLRGYVQRRRARRAPGEPEPVPSSSELEVPGL